MDLESVVQKEAVYCTVGRCCKQLKDLIPFEQWLAQLVSTEIRDKNPKCVAYERIIEMADVHYSCSFPILKRRIAWVIGKWISDESATPNNPVIWDALVYLLADRGPGSDAVVRFTAASAIKECLDVMFGHF